MNAFQHYMARNQLYVDVWDADSLLHVGTGCLDLRAGLRQRKSAVYFEDNIDIIWSEQGDSQRTGMRRSSSATSQMSILGGTMGSADLQQQTSKMATLHLRLTNIGLNKSSAKTHLGYDRNLAKPEVKQEVTVYDFQHYISSRAETVHESNRVSFFVSSIL